MQKETQNETMSNRNQPTANRRGFTLIEVLTVIVIIGILAAISIPAIGYAVRKAKQGAQAMEVNTLAQAVERYAMDNGGDYPPDGSSNEILQGHMRKRFPRMTEPDITLLARLTDDNDENNTGTTGTFSGVAMDRGEALVFFLGGFSKNLQLPLTGPGGPLDYIGPANPTVAQRQDLANYQYNATRDNSFFDFDPQRLTIARATDTSPLISTDETLLNNLAPAYGGKDLLPAYLAVKGQAAPIVYFDSRTYGVVFAGSADLSTPNTYNGFLAQDVGGIRPYKTEVTIEPPPAGGYTGTNKAKEDAAFAAFKFHNPDTFQIISPGLDGLFGSIVSTSPGNPAATPTIHFVTETGRPVRPLGSATSVNDLYFTDSKLGSKGFQDSEWGSLGENGHLDNVTNFSTSILGDGLQ